MKPTPKNTSTRFLLGFTIGLTAMLPPLVFAQSRPASSTDKDDEEDEEVVFLDPFCIGSSTLGATPGGAQDINFFRMGAGRGQIPHPNTFTAEGLFSEHDLPLETGQRGESLLCVQTAAMPARFEVLPDIRYLAQLGFSSGLRADTWQPAPLNLVAVVDKSGSMSGQPLALVRASLQSALKHMRDGDQFGIVLYGDRAHVHLAPTVVSPESRSRIATAINAIESAGSTAMEAGLQVGYAVARESKQGFEGTTRVMLFTDEQPNVGNTEAAGFMAMAEAASHDGIGLTTVGVGVQFGAELATKISSVRGGNLFFFQDGEEMKTTFAEDFDTMVTELAHDFSVRIEPAPGLRLAGVFGLPADLLAWNGDAIEMDVATIFLSRRKGAIYFALADAPSRADLPARRTDGKAPLARVRFSYTDAVDKTPVESVADCRLLASDAPQSGLSRGINLVDEYLTLKKATQVHLFDNDTRAAFHLVHGLLARLTTGADPDLQPEVDLVRDLHNTLAFLSGYVGEIRIDATASAASPLVGVWRRANGARDHNTHEFLLVWPNGVIEPVITDLRDHPISREDSLALAGPLPRETSGRLPITEADQADSETARYQIAGNTLTLNLGDWCGDGPAHLVFTRSSFDQLQIADSEEPEPTIDSLSGLPVDDATKLPSRISAKKGVHRPGTPRSRSRY